MSKVVYFRADGNSQIGLGHVIRSLALAEMLMDEFECHFFIRNPLPSLKNQILEVCKSIIELPETENDEQEAIELSKKWLTGQEFVVLDGYHFKTTYQQLIKNSGCKLVCIDDIHQYHFVADMVINHAPGLSISDYSIEPYTKVCIGLDYSLLRGPFLKAAKETREINEIKNIFICFGGSDFNNITLKLLMMLEKSKIPGIAEINVVLGGANKFKKEIEAFVAKAKKISFKLFYSLSSAMMCELMKKCHLAIVPASSILYEVVAVKMPVISGYYVENQINVYAGFHRLGLIHGIGNFAQFDRLQELISSILKNDNDQIIRKQQKCMPGMSKENYSHLFHSFSPQE